jgi:hypothetical protein
MTNKPEPVVTQEDQDAATAYRVARYRAALNNCELGAVDLDIAFAAHRTAAVARREAEIVNILWTLGMNAAAMSDMCDEDGASYASEVIAEAIKKIQNGGGA